MTVDSKLNTEVLQKRREILSLLKIAESLDCESLRS